MRKKLTSSGRSARNDTVRDLQNAINEMNAANRCLGYIKGLGAELYTEKIEELINRFSKLKNQISNLS